MGAGRRIRRGCNRVERSGQVFDWCDVCGGQLGELVEVLVVYVDDEPDLAVVGHGKCLDLVRVDESA
jgi:hypothetical protein